MTIWAKNDDRPAQPVRSHSPASHRGLLRQVAADGRGAARRQRRGADGHHRLPLRRGADPAAAGPVRRGAQGRGEIPGDLRQGELLPGDHGPRHRHREPGPRGAARHRAQAGHPAGGHQRLALHPRARPRRTTCCCACRPAANMADPNRFRFDGSGYYIKSADEMRADRQLRPLAGGLPQHAAGGREGRPRRDVRVPQPDAALPGPGGGDRGVLVPQGGLAGLARRYPAASRRRARQQAEYELGVITQMGFPSYFLVVADFIQWAKRPGHRGRARPWLGGRLAGRVRAGHHRPRPDRSTA